MKKYENFCATLQNLHYVYEYDEPYTIVILTGLVGLYKFCFEQSWKMMKKLLSQSGYAESATGSPRSILKLAYSAGMIHDEIIWMQALQARNNASHSYNENIALTIVRQTKKLFYPMFVQLQEEVEAHWI